MPIISVRERTFRYDTLNALYLTVPLAIEIESSLHKIDCFAVVLTITQAQALPSMGIKR